MAEDASDPDGTRADGGGQSAESPLEGLAREVGGREPSRPGWLDELGDAAEDVEIEDLWVRLEAGIEAESTAGTGEIAERPAEGPPASEARSYLPSYPSRAILVAHGLFTAASLSLSLIVYLLAALRIVPRHFWLFAVPLFALGVFGVVPIVAWISGIWQPRELR